MSMKSNNVTTVICFNHLKHSYHHSKTENASHTSRYIKHGKNNEAVV